MIRNVNLIDIGLYIYLLLSIPPITCDGIQDLNGDGLHSICIHFIDEN